MNAIHRLHIGTRASDLALAQTKLVQEAFLQAHSSVPELIVQPVTTTGDSITHKPLYDIGGKALFCKEIDQALLKGDIDIAVHSLKDVPTWLPEGITIAATLPRADCRDVILLRPSLQWPPKPQEQWVIGTSSLRRGAMLKARYPHLKIISIRGNVPTRLAMAAQGEVDGVILAHAGLQRLQRTDAISHIFSPQEMLPCAGQGVIAVLCRTEDIQTRRFVEAINHSPTFTAITAERAMLDTLNGSCRTPIGAYAYLEGETLHLSAVLASTDGTELFHGTASGAIAQASALGQNVAQQIIDSAGDAFSRLIGISL